MNAQAKSYPILVLGACFAIFSLCAAISAFAQSNFDTRTLSDQLRLRYELVALQDGVGLVPRQAKSDIRFIEVRQGAVAINGNTVPSSELHQRLGADADLILRVTYLDPAAQQSLVRGGSTAPPEGTETDSSQPKRTRTRGSDRVRFGGSVSVAPGEIVQGDVVAIGGSADIQGEVTGDATAIGGTLTLGPQAIVRGDAVVVGGSLNRSPGARVYGKVSEVSAGSRFNGRFARGFPLWTRIWSGGNLLVTVMRLSLLILGALTIVALARGFVETTANRMGAEPLRTGIAGLLAELLFVPLLVVTIVVLAVSIIGIPLLLLVPFAIVLAVIFMLVGFTGVAYQAGKIISNRFGIHRGPYLSVTLGVLGIFSLTLIARIVSALGGPVFGSIIGGPLSALGYLAEYLAWTVGAGAVILTWMSTRHRGPRAEGVSTTEGTPAA